MSRDIKLRDMEDNLIKLEASLSLFMTVKEGIHELISENSDLIDGALFSILNIQFDAVENIRKIYCDLIHRGSCHEN